MRSFWKRLDVLRDARSLLAGLNTRAAAQGRRMEVYGKIDECARRRNPLGRSTEDAPSAANVVVWLSPLKPGGVATPMMKARQHCPTGLSRRTRCLLRICSSFLRGSQVEFPNQGPLLP